MKASPVPGVGSPLRLARAVGYPLGVRLSALRRPFRTEGWSTRSCSVNTAASVWTVYGFSKATQPAFRDESTTSGRPVTRTNGRSGRRLRTSLEASSGKTTRHRLNRGGDRAANNALWTISMVRMRSDPRTRAYVTRRTAEGLSTKEIQRCLKRYIVRELYPLILADLAESIRKT